LAPSGTATGISLKSIIRRIAKLGRQGTYKRGTPPRAARLSW
jgi:hypothetical protein